MKSINIYASRTFPIACVAHRGTQNHNPSVYLSLSRDRCPTQRGARDANKKINMHRNVPPSGVCVSTRVVPPRVRPLCRSSRRRKGETHVVRSCGRSVGRTSDASRRRRRAGVTTHCCRGGFSFALFHFCTFLTVHDPRMKEGLEVVRKSKDARRRHSPTRQSTRRTEDGNVTGGFRDVWFAFVYV